jgi:hypothetical protein
VLVPYNGIANIPGGAEAVWLYLSRDRGVTWQKISEARPQVRAFNYRADTDGEYWFSIRTTDSLGRFWPAGSLEPELRVVVDTTIPQFDALSAVKGDDGGLEINWRIADENLDATALRAEVRTAAADAWQVIALPPPTTIESTGAAGQVTMPLSTTGRIVAVRLTATDLAGNQAASQTEVQPGFVGNLGSNHLPTMGPASGVSSDGGVGGWVASGETTSGANTIARAPVIGSQPWPADNVASAQSPAWAGSTERVADSVTKYGMPPSVKMPLVGLEAEATGRPASRFASHGEGNVADRGSDETSGARRTPFRPLEPFRQRSSSPPEGNGDAATHDVEFVPGDEQIRGTRPAGNSSGVDPWLWLSGPEVSLPAGESPRLVNSRTFLLEYELEDIGTWGVGKVELWGTRDGGRTWRSFATDDDHTSPMQVNVGEAGLYGFRIVVSGGGGAGGFPPQPGDRPELWVGVDLHRPEIELTATEPAGDELADHRMLRWWADDDNLERRPIGLFYSSRPGGPWTAIATNLENTGEFPWRLERHLPSRVYLRLEARDTAGNLAAYQTYEPVSIEPPSPAGRIESVQSVDGPTAWSLGDSPR